MIKRKFTYNALAVAISSILLTSCFKSEDSPGYEYTPDMYRSPAVEAYVDYGYVRDEYNDSLKLVQSAMHPPVGTIPFKEDKMEAAINMPYHRLPPVGWDKSHSVASLEYSTTDYDASVADKSPIAYTKEFAKQGEELYTKFCYHCHGKAGAGDGLVSRNDNINPPADAFNKPEGQMFYSITYGKGVMGAHASQLSKLERWKVIMHLKKLANGGKDLDEAMPMQVDSTAGVTVDTVVMVESPIAAH